MDEISNRLGDIWERQIDIENEYHFDYLRAVRRMNMAYVDMKSGGQWWTRNWLWSLPESKGGAPTTPIIVRHGISSNIFKLGPVYMNNKFSVKLTQYAFDIYQRPERHKWRLKIKPDIKVGLDDFIRRAVLTFDFIYSYKNKKLLSLQIYSGYRPSLKAHLGFQISMLHW